MPSAIPRYLFSSESHFLNEGFLVNDYSKRTAHARAGNGYAHGALPQGEQFGFGGYYDYGFGRGGHSGSHSSGQRRRHHHHQQQQQQGNGDGGGGGQQSPPPPPPPPQDDDNGYGYGFGIGYPMHPGMTHPAYRHHAIHAAHMAHHWMNPASTASRSLLLDPNRDSIVKVERYSFSFSPTQNLVRHGK